jgi:hypothetical protein
VRTKGKREVRTELVVRIVSKILHTNSRYTEAAHSSKVDTWPFAAAAEEPIQTVAPAGGGSGGEGD